MSILAIQAPRAAFAAALLVFAAALAHAPAATAAADLTATTWDEALTLSRQHDRPILIDFFTEW
jgi:hypothetical protein